MHYRIILSLLALLGILSGCQLREKAPEPEQQMLYLYTGKEVPSGDGTSTMLQAGIDKEMDVPATMPLIGKLQQLADTLSSTYFNGLKIQPLRIDSAHEKGNILLVCLAEPAGFQGPGSLPAYQSWYDFFQGSAGGGQTTVILRESFLQPDYKGEWIDGVIFFYRGRKMEDFDHVQLQGLLLRQASY